jgi:membrane associated rhomboid family serine protease
MNILLIIIGLNVLVSFKGFNDEAFFRKYLFHIGSIRSGEQIRMFSSAFLHVDFFHLVFNMITLYFFAPIVIQNLGVITFLTIYVLSLLLGNLLTLSLYKNQFNYSACGASGAVTGVLYSSVLLHPNMTIGIFGIIPMPAYLFGILYLFYSIYGMKSKSDSIGHAAHFGGAIGGFVLTLIKVPYLLNSNFLIIILLAIPIIVLFYLIKVGKI